MQDIVCSGQELEVLGKAVDEVRDVSKIDFSNNGIVDINPLAQLTRVIHLNLSNNKIKNVTVFTQEEAFPNLKWLDISFNKFVEFPAFKVPKLDYLNISGNKLEKVNDGWTGHENLRILNAVDNKFKTLAPFKVMPKLEELYLASNMLTSLSGWESLPVLRVLHLRRNKIDKIEEELPPLDELTTLNLRSNNISKLDQAVRALTFPKLESLTLINNPLDQSYSSLEVLCSEFLIRKPTLKRFCKINITEA